MLPQITRIFEFLGVHVSRGLGLIIRLNFNLNLSDVFFFFFVIVLITKVIATSTQILVVSIFHGK